MKKAVIAMILIFASFGLCFIETAGAGSGEPGSQEKVDQLRKAIAETSDNAKKAALYKELGEFYTSREDYKKAAEEYLKALSLYPGFPESELYKMALHVSWAGRTEDAIRILRKILEDNPDNVEARVHLARLLSWSGKAGEAFEEIEKVLKAHPDDRNALQAKAAILNLTGRKKDSILLSKRLLETQDDFDTRLGLSYALLSVRKIREAEENTELLKPVYPYQERELRKFTGELDKFIRPRYVAQYTYYEDSDKNVLNRYKLSLGKYIGDYDFTINYLYTSARDRTRHNRAHDILAETLLPITESTGLHLGAGANYSDAITHETSFTGYATLDKTLPGGSVGVTANRLALTDTAQLIENNITAVRLGLYGSHTLAGRLSLYTAYNYTDYSDNNYSHDVVVQPSFALLRGNPAASLSYTFRYVTFWRQSGSGYYDPNYILSNQLSVYFSYVKNKFSMSLGPYGGYQSTKRYGSHSHDFYGGGSAVVGYQMTRGLGVELFADAGNGALSTTGGWKYYQAGARLRGSF